MRGLRPGLLVTVCLQLLTDVSRAYRSYFQGSNSPKRIPEQTILEEKCQFLCPNLTRIR
jgi:hypothetical protein